MTPVLTLVLSRSNGSMEQLITFSSSPARPRRNLSALLGALRILKRDPDLRDLKLLKV